MSVDAYDTGGSVRVPAGEFFGNVLEELSAGKSVELLCRGDSMNPFFKDGRDRIRVAPPGEDAALHKGDVVLARTAAGHWVIHRVVSLNPLLLNGDGNFLLSQELTDENAVAAVMTSFRRKGRQGSVNGFRWRCYSLFWRVAGYIGIGNNNLRRVILALWRRNRISV